jgi:uncharacterized protein (TIGR02246 family)
MRWVVLWCLAPLLAVAAPDDAGIEKAVLRVCDQMTEAAQNLDADRMFSFVRDTGNGAIIQNGAILLTRDEALAQVKAGFQRLSKIEYRWKRRNVMVLSPTVAVLVADGESVVTTGTGDTFTTLYAQTVVYTLAAGEWKVQHAHHSSPPR